MLVCCAFFSPHLVLCVPSKQLNFSFIYPQNILPVALWNIQMHFRKLQTCSNVFFGQQWLPFVVSSHEHHSCLEFYVSQTRQQRCQHVREMSLSIQLTLRYFLTSLSFLRCALTVIFAGRPVLGRVATVLNFLHLQTICHTDEHQGFQRYSCNPFQLYASQQILIYVF